MHRVGNVSRLLINLLKNICCLPTVAIAYYYGRFQKYVFEKKMQLMRPNDSETSAALTPNVKSRAETLPTSSVQPKISRV